MASPALDTWRGERAARLEELFAALNVALATGYGGQGTVSEVHRALIVSLASHFQGFARDLQTLASVELTMLLQPRDHVVFDIVFAAFQAERWLDRRNAQEDSLASDFSRLGMDLWPAVALRDRHIVRRRETLRWLNRTRNAVVHGSEEQLDEVVRAGPPLTIRTIRQWRNDLDGLATTMDLVVAEHLAATFHVVRPW